MNILITGVSSGFGYEMAKLLTTKGHHIIGIARRENRLKEIQKELGEANFTGYTLDVSDRENAKKVIEEITKQHHSIDVLINNAGLALGTETADKIDYQDWLQMVNTNILGLTSLTHLILPLMIEKNSGYIINIGSTAGNWPYKGGNVYGATKAFVKQFSQNLRTDLEGTKVRVTNLEPGLCGETEFSEVRYKGDTVSAQKVYENTEPLTGKDIAETVDWLINTPMHMNVNRIEIMPTCQTYGGLKVTRG